MNGVRIPVATYRLQFHRQFGFEQARSIVDYLQRLGITDVYASPTLKSRSGSMHGYDVTDHSRLNPELGGEEAFEQFSDALRERELGLIVDVVPNHMEIDDDANRWWQDVLENGASSVYAKFFDIDWRPPKRDLRNRVLLPVLGDQFGKILENGEITLSYANGGFFVNYYAHRFPVDPRTTTEMLDTVAEHVRFALGPEDESLIELESIVTSLRHLPDRTTTDPDELAERQREKQVAKRRLARLAEDSAVVRRSIEGVLVEWSGRQGEPESFDRLEKLLREQVYRLSHWRVAVDEINYRRFFDINDLAAIRVEDPHVFSAVHEVVLRLISEGRVTGLRIDHPDGLYDPESYFLTLQNEARRVLPAGGGSAKLPITGLDCVIYIAVEKILGEHESLPMNWAVHGTTGYEMLNLINGLFVHGESREQLLQFYEQLYGQRVDFDDLVYQCKRIILKVSMSSEMHVLARQLDRLSEQHRWSRDFTMWSLHEALREVIACFPVYRTYIQQDTSEVTDEDRRQVETAVRIARRRNPATDRSVFDFIQSVLLLQEPEELSDEQSRARRDFVMKFQQLTGPVMAKGLEDTTFYRVYPLASLNEVGGEPGSYSVPLADFHKRNMVRCARWPYGMSATSTHDTKRSEDARAWMNVLSEIPQQWIERIERWQQWNGGKKVQVDGVSAPDSNEEYLLYQTLVGTWPLEQATDVQFLEYVERISQYMQKALREAKLHTSWVNPDSDYESAVDRFIRAILSRDSNNPFVADFNELRHWLDRPGMVNALGQALLKMTVPGVPDFYQGCELWSFNLVDPDNRRPVDYGLRARMLDEIQRREQDDIHGLLQDILDHWHDGRVKLFMTYRALNFRRAHLTFFLDGEYVPVEAQGDHASNVCAFLRRDRDKACLVVVPLFTMNLTHGDRLPLGDEVWQGTTLALPATVSQRWRNVLTDEELSTTDGNGTLAVGAALQRFPVALLEAL